MQQGGPREVRPNGSSSRNSRQARRRAALREAALLLLFVVSWAVVLVPVSLLVGLAEPWMVTAGWVGLAALVVLVLRWLLSGVLGYESRIGLRILRTERVPR